MTASIISISPARHVAGTDDVLRLEMQGDWIALAVSHQSHTENFGAGGIIMPESWTIATTTYICALCGHKFDRKGIDEKAFCPTCRTDSARATAQDVVAQHADESMSGDHYATVIGVGPEVEGIAFGHRVQVTRWASGRWFYDWPNSLPKVAADVAHDNRRIAIPPKARLAYVKAEHLVFIITDFAGMAGWPQGMLPGMYPGPGRVYLLHDPPPAVGLGLADIERSPYPTQYATVLDAWPGCGVPIGARVLVNDAPQCTFWPESGSTYSMTMAEDVLAIVRPQAAIEATA